MNQGIVEFLKSLFDIQRSEFCSSFCQISADRFPQGAKLWIPACAGKQEPSAFTFMPEEAGFESVTVT
jgi:hypothetical protein